MSEYKPTEHDGLKKDGTPDKRVGTGEFAYGKVDPHTAGKKRGITSGNDESDASENSGGNTHSSEGIYKPTEHDGLRKDGKPDGRLEGN